MEVHQWGPGAQPLVGSLGAKPPPKKNYYHIMDNWLPNHAQFCIAYNYNMNSKNIYVSHNKKYG